jgi:RNA methyltransferase, TrmH family
LAEALGNSHQLIRRLRRLGAERSERKLEGACLLEGPDLISSAFANEVVLEGVFITDRALHEGAYADIVRLANDRSVPLYEISDRALTSAADTKSPQPILASARCTPRKFAEHDLHGTVVVVHDLSDPGNLGTIIRVAQATGVAAVVVSGRSSDPFGPKALRASAGAAFAVPILEGSVDRVLDAASVHHVPTVATVVAGARDPRDVNLGGDCVILIGSEAHGLPDEIANRASAQVTVPMEPGIESLNAAVAASLVMYEAMYQRRNATETS